MRRGPVKTIDQQRQVGRGMDGLDKFFRRFVQRVQRDGVDVRVGALGENDRARVVVEAVAEVQVMRVGGAERGRDSTVVAAGKFLCESALVAQVRLAGERGFGGGELAEIFFVREYEAPITGEAGEIAAARSEDKFPSGVVRAGMGLEREAELEQRGARRV